MSAIMDYYSDWKTKTFTSECGWSGPGASLTTELFAELIQCSCPRCDTNVVLIPLPRTDSGQ